ncbi:MAG TPA: shikimate dehydrogenase [Niallia sp.]|nr:shikimate dehydrogenase [Niallia sp.]
MKKYMVIGDPIKHSMSPAMHNDLFQAYGIDAKYETYHIKRGMLESGLEELRNMKVDGFNVTVPHKTDIIPYLDELDPLSEAIGAVNTVVQKNGKWIGYNTDGYGFLQALEQEKVNLKEQKVLIIGAGGAARAIYFTLAHYGVKWIDICNRTVERANMLKEDCPFEVHTNILNISEAESSLENYSLVIQTTSIGMSPNIEVSPINLHYLRSDSLVSDIIYNPLETMILRTAKAKGARIQNGIDMFVFQGALAFEKWQGFFPDTDRMRKIVLNQLGG